MPSDIRCYLGRYLVPASLQPPPLSFGATLIEDHYRNASTPPGTGVPDIRLSFDTSRWDNQLNPAGTNPLVSPNALNNALSDLLRPKPMVADPGVIGVILSTRYEPDQLAFGVMFTPFKAQLDAFGGLPRTGAAVFLDRVKNCRPTDRDFWEQVGFTAAHEIGHMFNLGHTEPNPPAVPANFMSSTDPAKLYPKNTTFDGAQCEWLCQCSAQANVHPGLSDYRDTGTLQVADTASRPDRAFRSSPLQLKLTTPQAEAHYFEPLELDIAIGLAPGQTRARTIPHEIDPGYDSFTVWITEPDGERRRYRPTEQYCPSYRRLRLEPRRPFERDLTLFGSAQGYTFRKAGVHRIEAVFTPPQLAPVRSNVVEIMIKPDLPSSEQYRELADTLTQPGVASLLYYREARRGSAALGRLAKFCERRPRTAAAAGGHYALGRALVRQARAAGTKAARERHAEAATYHLRAALRSRHLAGRRAERADQLLKHRLAL